MGQRQQLGKVTLHGLNVCDIIVRLQDVAKDLGSTLGFPDDDDQSNCKRVQDIHIISLKYHENWEIFTHYGHSFVTSRFDSNSALLYIKHTSTQLPSAKATEGAELDSECVLGRERVITCLRFYKNCIGCL